MPGWIHFTSITSAREHSNLYENKKINFFVTLGNFSALLSSADFFSESIFSKNSFTNTGLMSSRLDPDQARRVLGPDLGPNCLQKLSADDIRRSP